MGVPSLAVLDPTAHEEEPRGVPVGISVQCLTKIYDEACLCIRTYHEWIVHTVDHKGHFAFCTISVVH